MSPDLTRREFLEVSAAAGLVAVASPAVSRDVNADQRRTLLGIARTLFPHRGVGEEPYLRAVVHLEQQCRRDFRISHAVKNGVERIDWLSNWDFSAIPERERVLLLKRTQHADFFGVLYRELLEGLYGSPDSWRLLVRAGR